MILWYKRQWNTRWAFARKYTLEEKFRISVQPCNILYIALIVRSLTWEWSAAHYNCITLQETKKRNKKAATMTNVSVCI